YIAGAGVARGYLKNNELTEEKFVDNPFIPGEKMYRSGDLGRWNLDKTLEFFGRCDEQVKIRGYRIEPGEIEKQLVKIENIKDAVVVVVEDKGGQKSLCAYMVPDDGIKAEDGEAEWFDIKDIRKKLNENLPDYMIPSFFVSLEKIPLTNNGKVDRRALPEPQVKTKAHPGSMPANEIEITIRKIWSDVLAVEGIGMEDNFFELGGDSIKAVQIASRMSDRELSVNAKDILEFQTIDQVILNVDFDKEKKVYDQGIIKGTKKASPIESWFFENNFKHPHYFNQSVLLEFEEEIDREIMAKCFKTLIEHHDGLRLNADPNKKSLFYNNRHLEKAIEIEVFDIPDGEEKIKEIGKKIKSSFDIQDSLLIKPAIIKLGTGKQKLLITAHHLVIDGVSWRILLEDLYNLYRGFLNGEEVTLPDKSASLTDWSESLREYSQTEALNEEIPYWNKAIMSDFSIETGNVSPDGLGVIKDREKTGFEMDQEQTDILSTGSRKTFNSDIEVLLITALGIALKEYTGSEEIVIETENHGRHLEEVDLPRSIGWFTAMYPKLIVMDKEDLTGRIKSIKEQLAKTPNKGIGYGILKYISGKLTSDFNSRVRFNYLGQFDREVSNDIFCYSDLDTGSDISEENGLSTLIEINCIIIQGKLVYDLFYNRETFGRERIEGVSENI
ncbi:MAG: AMP-binding protein, partial [bacterium]|nr:AMP-binding protein [bacterium]